MNIKVSNNKNPAIAASAVAPTSHSAPAGTDLANVLPSAPLLVRTPRTPDSAAPGASAPAPRSPQPSPLPRRTCVTSFTSGIPCQTTSRGRCYASHFTTSSAASRRQRPRRLRTSPSSPISSIGRTTTGLSLTPPTSPLLSWRPGRPSPPLNKTSGNANLDLACSKYRNALRPPR